MSKAGLAFIKNGSAKKPVTFDVQYYFRRTFCRSEKLIRLKTLNACQSEERVRFGQAEDVVWNRINAKLTLEEVLHHVSVSQLGQVRYSENVSSNIRPIFKTKPVSSGRNVLSGHGRLIQVRVLI